VFEFFRSLFRPEGSSVTAKERLRLVLLSDHLSLSPEIVDALKADLLAVISRYVEIDAEHADVTFEHRDHEVAMLASIPIRALREERRRASLEAPARPQPAATPATPRRRRRRKTAAAPAPGASQPQVPLSNPVQA